MLEGEEEGETSVENDKFEKEEEEPLMSVHAIVGATRHQTLRIRGNIKKKAIIILIDLGSTHNFLDVMVAKRIGCIIQQDKPLMIVVVDGTKIASSMTCKQLTWSMQGKEFKAYIRLIPLRREGGL